MYNKDTTPSRSPILTKTVKTLSLGSEWGISTSERYRWKRFKRGQRQRPLGLQFLHKAKEANYIILEEGETGFATLLHNDIPALGLPGAGSWNDDWIGHFDGIDEVFVWEEPTTPAKGLLRRSAQPCRMSWSSKRQWGSRTQTRWRNNPDRLQAMDGRIVPTKSCIVRRSVT